MVVAPVIALWAVIGCLLFMWLRWSAMRDRTYERFEQAIQNATAESLRDGEQLPEERSIDGQLPVRGVRRLSRDWIWLPWVAGGCCCLDYLVGFPLAAAICGGHRYGRIAAASQLESVLHTRQIAILERQLADAIDIMVGAVSAGAGVGPALEAATLETDRPLKPYLEELSGAFAGR